MRIMILLLLHWSVLVEGTTLPTATRGLYVGKATGVTKACWPSMARIHLFFEPTTEALGRVSTLSLTQENGRSSCIASGEALAYPTSVFMTDRGSGTCFFINSEHTYPGGTRKPVPFPARIPFCIKDGSLTAFLDAREDENGRVYHVDCPVHLEKVSRRVSVSPVRPEEASAEVQTSRQTLVPRHLGVAASGLRGRRRVVRGRARVVKILIGIDELKRQERLRLIEVNDESVTQEKTRDGDTLEEASLHDEKGRAASAASKTLEKEVVDDIVMDDERQVASGFDAASKEEGGVIIGNVMTLDERGPTSGSSSASGVDAVEVVEDAVMRENAMASGSSLGCSTPELSPAAARLYSQTRLIPFVKQGTTGLARVIVEGAIVVLGKLVTLCGPVYLTCESTDSDASFIRLPPLRVEGSPLYPSQIRGLQSLGCYYFGAQSQEEITPELATAEGIMKISPLRMDNIYICINSGMWRIHLGEETVDGWGREVVLPLVDVDDPFDPLD